MVADRAPVPAAASATAGVEPGGDGDGGGEGDGLLTGPDGGGQPAHLRRAQGKLGAGGELVDGELEAGRRQLQREAVQADDLEQRLRELDDLERQREHRPPQQLAAVSARMSEEPALERGHARGGVEDVKAPRPGLDHQVGGGRRGKLAPDAGQQAQHAPLGGHARVVKGLDRRTHTSVVVRSVRCQDSTKV